MPLVSYKFVLSLSGFYGTFLVYFVGWITDTLWHKAVKLLVYNTPGSIWEQNECNINTSQSPIESTIQGKARPVRKLNTHSSRESTHYSVALKI